jgi:peptidoglycan hydrolase-like protein with peptidoglycan-binding domain
VSVITYKRGDKTALTKNFSRYEFDCPCGCGTQMVDPELAEKLQRIRDVVGKKIKITSGYRCLKRNQDAGGGTNSRHRYGMAADWRLEDRSLNPVALGILAVEAGFGGVGIYWYGNYAFVHADTRNAKATWLCDAKLHYPSTTYLKFILPTIRRGCTGDANRAATKMLQRLLGLTPDGIFGEGTENALLKAQEAHGLAVDGICGPASWKAISGASKYL